MILPVEGLRTNERVNLSEGVSIRNSIIVVKWCDSREKNQTSKTIPSNF